MREERTGASEMRWRVPRGNPACEGQPKPDAARKPPPHLQQTKICCGAKVLVASAHHPFYRTLDARVSGRVAARGATQADKDRRDMRPCGSSQSTPKTTVELLGLWDFFRALQPPTKACATHQMRSITGRGRADSSSSGRRSKQRRLAVQSNCACSY